MTAIGFVLLIVGLILLWIGVVTSKDNLPSIGIWMATAGAFLFIAGISIWLWRVMP